MHTTAVLDEISATEDGNNNRRLYEEMENINAEQETDVQEPHNLGTGVCEMLWGTQNKAAWYHLRRRRCVYTTR